MEQVLIGGYYDDLPTAATGYSALGGGSSWSDTEWHRSQGVGAAGKIGNLHVKLTVAPGAGKSWTFTLRLNGAATLITFAISNLETTGEDTVNEVAISPGDRLSLECVPSGTPASPSRAIWTSKFTGDNAKESLLLNGVYLYDGVSTMYVPLNCYSGSALLVESEAYSLIPTSGKLKNLYVAMDVDPGDAPEAYTFMVRLNDGDTALTCSIVADNITCNDVAHEVAVLPGDVVTIRAVPVSNPSVIPNCIVGLCFEADTDGESMIFGGSTENLLAGTLYHMPVGANREAAWSSEVGRRQYALACALKKLYVALTGSPGEGKSYTFTLRDDAAGTALAVTIADAATSGNNTVNVVSVGDLSLLAMECAPANTPTVRQAYWGLVNYMAPAAAGGGSGGFSAGAARLLA